MEATQNLVTRETPRGGLRPIVYVAAPAIALVLGLGVHAAYAACITPTGPASATGTVTFKDGVATVTCTATVNFTVPAAPASCTPPDPVCVNTTSVTFSNCSGSALGINFSAALASHGTWQICLSGSGTASQLKIPAGGVTATATIGGSHCSTVSGPATTVSGAWNNTNSLATFTNQSVTVTNSGPFPCPTGNSATFSGSFTASNVSTQAWLSIH